jgi:hypothetical protein
MSRSISARSASSCQYSAIGAMSRLARSGESVASCSANALGERFQTEKPFRRIPIVTRRRREVRRLVVKKVMVRFQVRLVARITAALAPISRDRLFAARDAERGARSRTRRNVRLKNSSSGTRTAAVPSSAMISVPRGEKPTFRAQLGEKEPRLAFLDRVLNRLSGSGLLDVLRPAMNHEPIAREKIENAELLHRTI